MDINEIYIYLYGLYWFIWSGWWYTYPSEKYESHLDYDIPNIYYIYMEKENIFQTTNQGTLVPYFRP